MANPVPIVVTDSNGKTLTITGSTSGSQVASPVPCVLTDVNGNALVLGTSGGGGSTTWDAIGNAAGSLTLANGADTTTFNQTANTVWAWANTTTATIATTNASPIHTLSANYWTGAASAVDSWTIGTSLAAGANGATNLNISHSGSTGTALVSVGATISAANGTNSHPSFTFAGNLAYGFYFNGTTSAPVFAAGADIIRCGSGGWTGIGSFVWGWATALGGADTGLSRSAAGVVCVGTGAQASVAGTLNTATLIENATLSPTSAATAGVTGQIAWDSGKIYVCTSGGIAGSATWKAATLTSV